MASHTVSFRHMAEGTPADYQLLDDYARHYAAGLPDRLLVALQRLDTSLDGYRVSRLTHSLQTATRAEAAGADDELVIGALLHDIGDDLAPYNHAAFAAAILRPYVRDEVTWIISQHGLFQTYYYAHHLGGDRHRRDKFEDHPWYSACVRFCEWDQASFDPDYPTQSLEHFEPLVRSMFLKTVHDHSAQG